MPIDEASFKSALAQLGAAVAELPRHESLGYQGEASYLRAGLYFEFNTDAGIHVADPAQLLLGKVALRQWITVRGGKAGGKETVQPGGGLNIGGFGVAGILRLLTQLGTVPGLAMSGVGVGSGMTVSHDHLRHELAKYLGGKAIKLL